MQVFCLPDALLSKALSEPELGMGFQEVELNFRYRPERGMLLSGTYFLPSEFMTKVAHGTKNNESMRHIFLATKTADIVKPANVSPDAMQRILVLPDISIADRSVKMAAMPEFEDETVCGDVFYRLSAFKDDKRINTDGSVTPGTYCTSDNDFKMTPSGLAAVGRYALPSPLPAIHVFLITPPPKTKVAYGTVRPNFGMAGGGVEAYFPNGIPRNSAHYYRTIPIK